MTVIVMCGLPVSGKTSTAARLHAVAGGTLIRSCDVYQSLGIVLPEWVRRTRGFTMEVAAYDAVRDDAYREMDRRLPHDRQPRQRMGIGIAAEQQRLVHQHRAVPDIGRAAEPRQRHARDHRLDEEQQKAAHENRHREQRAARGGLGFSHSVAWRRAARDR